MIAEMQALEHNNTWEAMTVRLMVVGCRWVYAIKVGSDSQVDRLKARLVANGYTQIYGLDYCDTFSLVAKMTTIRIFFATVAIHHWPLLQLEIKNAFLHGDLEEEVTWSNLLGLLLRGSLVWCANCIALYTVSNNHHVPSLEYSAPLFKVLG